MSQGVKGQPPDGRTENRFGLSSSPMAEAHDLNFDSREISKLIDIQIIYHSNYRERR